GSILYHHLLHWSLLYWLLERYSTGWEVRIEALRTPSSHSVSVGPVGPPGMEVSRDRLHQLLAGSIFQNVEMFSLFSGGLKLPPGSRFSILVPKKVTTGISESGFIRIENKFCSLSIRVAHSSGVASLGLYHFLLRDDAPKEG